MPAAAVFIKSEIHAGAGEAFEKERQETEVGSAAIGAVVETNGNIRKIVKFNRIIRPVFAVFNKSKETVKKVAFSAESFIILFVFSEWIIQ